MVLLDVFLSSVSPDQFLQIIFRQNPEAAGSPGKKRSFSIILDLRTPHIGAAGPANESFDVCGAPFEVEFVGGTPRPFPIGSECERR